MRQLRTQNDTNTAANLLSDSTWNPDDFCSEISATAAMLSSGAIPLRKHPGEYRELEACLGWVPA